MDGKQIIKLLKDNGWELKRIQGSHYILIKNEKIVSVPVHGKKDIPKGTLNAILKQSGLK